MGKEVAKPLEEYTIAEVRSSMTDLQLAFADHWLVCRNRVKAAELAGYGGNYNALGVIGSRTLKSTKVQRLIALYFIAGGASQHEAAAILSGQARARMGDFLDTHGKVDPQKVRAAGPGIVQSWNPDTGTLRLYSAQEAAKVIYSAGRQDVGKGPGELSGSVVIEFVKSEEHAKLKPGS